MNHMELIMTRKSVRTFDGRPLTNADREKLCAFIATISNPYGIPVEFVLLDAEEHGLSSPVIQGEHLYIAGKVQKVEHCEEAFGYSFEQLVLYAWSLGIGTTWIGGTMKRELFEAAAQVKEGELMPIVSPLGYPAKEKSEVDVKLRNSVHGDDCCLLPSFSLMEIFPGRCRKWTPCWKQSAGPLRRRICSPAASSGAAQSIICMKSTCRATSPARPGTYRESTWGLRFAICYASRAVPAGLLTPASHALRALSILLP